METESIPSETSSRIPVPQGLTAETGFEGAPHEELESEQDRPKIKMIGAIVISTLAVLFAVVVGVNQIFRSVFNHEISSKQLEHQGSELRELRAEEQAKLSRYQWVNRKDGVVRIPVERARELTLAAYRSRAAKPEVGGDAARPPTGTH
jgi:hypothetical protein